jgi:hypothetical protein
MPHYVRMASDIATCMYYSGVDPFTKKEVHIARNLNDRKLQRAMLQFFKPKNYFEVLKALKETGRTDLIGGGCDALIPTHPPKEARRERANRAARGEHVHAIPHRADAPSDASRKPPGYRPRRSTARRRDRRAQ